MLSRGGVNYYDTPLPFSWFCYVIIIYYIAFYCSIKLTKHIGVTIILMLLLTILNYIILGRWLHFGDWWYRSTWGFNLGMIVRLYEPLLKSLIRRYIILLLFVVPFGLFCIYASGHFGIDMEIYAIGFSLLSLVLIYITGFKSSKYFKWLGKYSYEIYLCHPMAISIYPLWPMTGVTGDLIYFVFLLFSTMVLSILLNKLTKMIFEIVVKPI